MFNCANDIDLDIINFSKCVSINNYRIHNLSVIDLELKDVRGFYSEDVILNINRMHILHSRSY
jgi:hypothetical protein